jgi:hypothetical protein
MKKIHVKIIEERKDKTMQDAVSKVNEAVAVLQQAAEVLSNQKASVGDQVLDAVVACLVNLGYTVAPPADNASDTTSEDQSATPADSSAGSEEATAEPAAGEQSADQPTQ